MNFIDYIRKYSQLLMDYQDEIYDKIGIELEKRDDYVMDKDNQMKLIPYLNNKLLKLMK